MPSERAWLEGSLGLASRAKVSWARASRMPRALRLASVSLERE